MEQPGYAECATALFSIGIVDTVTTDNIILAGLALTRGRPQSRECTILLRNIMVWVFTRVTPV